MALEHNLIYFATRVKATKDISSLPQDKKKISFPISQVRSIVDIRKKADELGLSLPIVLRRMHDPDEIYNIIDDDFYSFVDEKSSLNRLKDSINIIKKKSSIGGTKPSLVASNYYAVLYSSYIRHVEELDKIKLDKVEGIIPND